MKLVGVKSLKPESVLAMPVQTSIGKVVLNSGVVLNLNYINKLKQLGIDKVYIEDERFSDIVITEPIDLNVRNNAIRVIEGVYDCIQKDRSFDEFQIKETARSIVEYVREHKDKGVAMLSTEVKDEYIIGHSINVAILAAFMGNRMNFNYNQLCDMVTGALIHDLGRENAADENPSHIQKGFDIMRKCRGLSLFSSIVCYEHHEKHDGSGYPRKLKGTGISEFTRVIKVADAYDDILHGYGSNDTSLMPHQAYEHILGMAGSELDPEIVERFRDTIVFYPNACTVLLSNNLKGIVVRQNLGAPQRPVVRMFNSRDEIMGEIDLFKNLTLFIKDIVTI